MMVVGGELAKGTMGTWKAKLVRQGKKGVTTSGKSKGGYCVATAEQRYFAKQSRSYKDPNYHAWTVWADRANKQ